MRTYQQWLLAALVLCALGYLFMDTLLLETTAVLPPNHPDIIITEEVKSLLATLSQQKTKQEDETIVFENDAQYEINPEDEAVRYFVYQPLSGFKQQRAMLRMAMRVANAMQRTLVVPMFSPFSPLGYAAINSSTEMIPVDRVLNMEALSMGLTHGVKVYRGSIATLDQVLPAGKWRVHSKKPSQRLNERDLKTQWSKVEERVMYWKRTALVDCCQGAVQMTPYIMFHHNLKVAARKVLHELFHGNPFHAVHVQPERYSWQTYFETRLLARKLNTTVPLFVYTETENLHWFNGLREMGYHIVFQHHFRPYMGELLSTYPQAMERDVLNYVAQIVASQATVWVPGENAFAIDAMRNFPPLVQVDWKKQGMVDIVAATVYSRDTQTKGLPTGVKLTNEPE